MRVWGGAWPAGAAASTCRAGLGPPATSGNPTDREHIDDAGRFDPRRWGLWGVGAGMRRNRRPCRSYVAWMERSGIRGRGRGTGVPGFRPAACIRATSDWAVDGVGMGCGRRVIS